MASLGRFAATRVLTGAIGLASVLVLARWMPVPEFAAYSVLFAAVTVSSVVGSLGIDRVLYREIPVAHLAGAKRDVKRLIRVAMVARLAVAAPVAVVIIAVTRPDSFAMGLDESLIFSAALASSLVLTDVAAITANALLRFETQARLTTTALVVKLAAAMALHAFTGTVTAPAMLAVAFVTDMLQAAASYRIAIRPALQASSAEQARGSYTPLSLASLFGMATTNYVSYLLGLPWQGSAATLIVGATSGAAEVALFALLQNLLDRMRQYLPLQLLQNAFEPILVRRYASQGDGRAIAIQLELLRRANFCILLGGAALCQVCGSELISLVTKGKYTGGGPLAAIMLLALAVRGISGALFISANVMNQMGRMTRAYAVVTALIVPLLFWAASAFGARGVVVVSILPSVLLWAFLRVQSVPCAAGLWRFDKDAACLVAGVLSALAGWVLARSIDGLPGLAIATFAVAALYVALLVPLRVFDQVDKTTLRAGLRGHVA